MYQYLRINSYKNYELFFLCVNDVQNKYYSGTPNQCLKEDRGSETG